MSVIANDQIPTSTIFYTLAKFYISRPFTILPYNVKYVFIPGLFVDVLTWVNILLLLKKQKEKKTHENDFHSFITQPAEKNFKIEKKSALICVLNKAEVFAFLIEFLLNCLRDDNTKCYYKYVVL